MAVEYPAPSSLSARALLAALVQDRAGWLPDDYALFFVTSEGMSLPGAYGALEEASGYAVHRHGDVVSWWLGWNPNLERPALTVWEPAQPQPRWRDSAEYRRARALVGLGD